VRKEEQDGVWRAHEAFACRGDLETTFIN
jgi:hypothetical protein